ncbi:fibronectin type III domain-containing protein [Desulfotalea psychrophila]|uniref:Fibronectin type-III domain-containing protein n=1 Tax=Desulfotalea psychrophila (strain LSv54 / DSM 12343) TaxID=177439 RepID=Q6AR61_DESPS|nr:fibronectin type III domain-containing protein [Desulfotalea psychrophila]CAG35163.1 hypothetical protein DP0434 [Desulfotalea psychrophila LSv54]
MKMAQRLQLGCSVLVGALLLVSGGCGFKNPPVAPQTVVPTAIRDLRYTIDAEGAHLTWSYPLESVAGTKLQSIDSFDFYRGQMPLEEVCENCPIPFDPPTSLPGGEVFDGETPQRGELAVSSLVSGNKYFFAIRSRTSWWAASSDSNIVSFIWFTPAAAPANFKVLAGDGQIELSWQPVERLIDGSSSQYPLLYQVQRSSGGASFQNIGDLLESTGYLDRRVARGKKYSYRVQSLMDYQGEFAQGSYSKVAQVESVDRTAPPTPRGLLAIRVGAGIKLVWQGVKVDDLAGYRLYRRGEDQKDFSLVKEVAADVIVYTDPVPDKGRYFYVVRAIDTAQPANESPASQEAFPRYQ